MSRLGIAWTSGNVKIELQSFAARKPYEVESKLILIYSLPNCKQALKQAGLYDNSITCYQSKSSGIAIRKSSLW